MFLLFICKDKLLIFMNDEVEVVYCGLSCLIGMFFVECICIKINVYIKMIVIILIMSFNIFLVV